MHHGLFLLHFGFYVLNIFVRIFGLYFDQCHRTHTQIHTNTVKKGNNFGVKKLWRRWDDGLLTWAYIWLFNYGWAKFYSIGPFFFLTNIYIFFSIFFLLSNLTEWIFLAMPIHSFNVQIRWQPTKMKYWKINIPNLAQPYVNCIQCAWLTYMEINEKKTVDEINRPENKNQTFMSICPNWTFGYSHDAFISF